MKHKKIIAIALCAGLILSSIGTVLAEINMEDLEMTFIKNKGTGKNKESHNTVNCDASIPEPESSVFYIKDLLPSENEEILYEGEKEQPGVNDPSVNDKYKMDADEIEELLSKGNSIEDIFKADEIGNEINEDPKNILERKKENKKDFQAIKEDILKEKRTGMVQKLADRHPEEYQKIKNEKLDEGSQIVLLGFLEENDVKSVESLIKDYKADGQKALEKHKNKKSDLTIKEKISKNGLSQADIEGISADKFSKMEEFCRKNNIDMVKMTKDLNAQKEKMKGVIEQ